MTAKHEKLKRVMAPRGRYVFHPGFCLSLLDNAKYVAKKHPTRLAWRALDAIRKGNTDESAQALDDLMCFMAPDVEVALADSINNPHEGQFRPYAAGLYLYGVDAGLWKGVPDVIGMAQTIYVEDDAPKPDRHKRAKAVRTYTKLDAGVKDTLVKLQAQRIIMREEAVATLKAHGKTIRDVLISRIGKPGIAERDRLLTIEKVLLGVEAGFWTMPKEWRLQ